MQIQFTVTKTIAFMFLDCNKSLPYKTTPVAIYFFDTNAKQLQARNMPDKLGLRTFLH